MLLLNYVWQSSKGSALINATMCVIKLDELLFDFEITHFSVPLLFHAAVTYSMVPGEQTNKTKIQ